MSMQVNVAGVSLRLQTSMGDEQSKQKYIITPITQATQALFGHREDKLEPLCSRRYLEAHARAKARQGSRDDPADLSGCVR
jgi:hypothetical protein